MPETIIILVGLPGSGKSTILKHFKKKYDIKGFKTGDVIREERKRRGLKNTKENDAKISEWFHSNGREKLMAERIWAKAKKLTSRIVVLDGLRSSQQLKHLQKISRIKPIIVSLEAPFEIRAKRMLKRKRWGSDENIEYLKKREAREKKLGLMKLIKSAKYHVDCSGSIKSSEINADTVIKEIIRKSA